MRVDSLKPSQRKKGRFLLTLENGAIIRITEDELLRFGLREGMELTTVVVIIIIAVKNYL